MDATAWGTYFVALAALTAAPGPVMAVIIARSIGQDGRGALAFAAGLCLGDVVGVCAVALGIGVWAEAKPELFAVIKYVGIAYLLWLAIGIWNSRMQSGSAARRNWIGSVGAGAALCLGNPSTFLIYALLLPHVAPNGIAGAEHLGWIVLITFAAVGIVFFGTVLVARQMHRLLTLPATSAVLSRMTAVVIAVTSLWMAAS